MCGAATHAGPRGAAPRGKHNAMEAGMASMAAMPLVAPLFIENGQLSTSVSIVSAMARATTVDVILLDQNGIQITAQTYPLDGHAQQVVKVSDLLQAANSAVPFGSVKIETDAQAEMNMSVLAQASITGTTSGGPVYLEEELPMTTPGDSGVVRAVAPAGLGFPVLALRSTSSTSQTVTVSCLYEHGGVGQSTVQLAPGAMVLHGACVAGSEQLPSLDAGWNQQTLDSKGAIGISVSSTGGVGALCVYGFAMAGQAGSPIYTSLNFTDAGGLSSGNTVFAGVPIGQQTLLGSDVFTPTLSLTNFGAKAVTATITLAVTNGNGPSGKKLATVTVAGQSSVTVPLGAMTGDSQMRNSFIVQSTGGQGMLYAGLTVFGGTTYRSVQLPGKDWWRPYNGGAHPWTTASATNSTLLLFNYADTPNQLTVAIGAGGMLWQQSYQLAPMETRALDIGNLIATGAKDQNGQVLPKSATAGVVNWFTLGFGQAMGRLLVSQPGIGLARSFNCDTIEAYCGTSEMPNNSLTIPASQGAPMGPYEVDMCTAAMGECEGDYDTSAPTSTNWSSSNTSVASIPASQGEAVAEISGISGGSATITANGVTEVLYDEIDGENYGCEAPGQSGVANVYDPTPVITGVSPTTGFVVGEAGAVTLTGQNFGTNKPQVSFSLGGTVTVSSNTDTSIQASLTAASAGTGTFTVTSEGYDGQSFKSSSGQNQQSGASPSVAVAGAIQFAVNGKSFIFVGTDPKVISSNTFYASNGDGGYPTPSGGTLSATSSSSSDTVNVISGPPPEVQFTTSVQSTNSGDRALTFKYTAGSQSSSQPINVTARKFAYLTNNSPSNTCSLGYGTSTTYTYTVYTHPGTGQAVDGTMGLTNAAVTESFSPAPSCGQHTGDGGLNANGQFTDDVTYCSSSPLTCSETSTQTLAVAGFQVRTNTITWSSHGISYTSNGPTQ